LLGQIAFFTLTLPNPSLISERLGVRAADDVLLPATRRAKPAQEQQGTIVPPCDRHFNVFPATLRGDDVQIS
jgi:hypothetical protein